MITKAEALKLMEETDERGKRYPMSIRFVTADREAFRKRNKQLKQTTNPDVIEKLTKMDVGGELLELDLCTLLFNKRESEKNPRHFQNRTRNVKLPNGQIRKFHISLLTAFKHPLLEEEGWVTVIH